jgi:hypothetical protein
MNDMNDVNDIYLINIKVRLASSLGSGICMIGGGDSIAVDMSDGYLKKQGVPGQKYRKKMKFLAPERLTVSALNFLAMLVVRIAHSCLNCLHCIKDEMTRNE